MAAEAALGNLAFRRAAERQAPVLQLVHGFHRFPGQNFRRILVNQVVPALDGVEHVPFPVVLFVVAERRPDAALGGAGVGTNGVELAENSHVPPDQVARRHQTGAAGADDDRLVLVIDGRLCHRQLPGCQARTT